MKIAFIQFPIFLWRFPNNGSNLENRGIIFFLKYRQDAISVFYDGREELFNKIYNLEKSPEKLFTQLSNP